MIEFRDEGVERKLHPCIQMIKLNRNEFLLQNYSEVDEI